MAQGKTDYTIKVAAQAFYLDEQSDPAHDRYVFAYTVVIQNHGNIPAKLLSRHWIITDSNGKIEEVRGEGVVGEQPYLRPGEGFHGLLGELEEQVSGGHGLEDRLEHRLHQPLHPAAGPGVVPALEGVVVGEQQVALPRGLVEEERGRDPEAGLGEAGVEPGSLGQGVGRVGLVHQHHRRLATSDALE